MEIYYSFLPGVLLLSFVVHLPRRVICSSGFRRCGGNLVLSSAAFFCSVFLLLILPKASVTAVGIGIITTNSFRVLRPTQEELISFNRRILEHKASSACLSVNPDENKLVLDNCNWDKGRVEIEGTFSIVPSNPGGHLLRWTNGPKPSGTEVCLAIPREDQDDDDEDDPSRLKERASKNADISLSQCDSKSPGQNWFFQRIFTEDDNDNNDKKLFLIRKYGYENNCIGVTREDETFQLILKKPCDEKDSEQVWKICDTLSDTSLCSSE